MFRYFAFLRTRVTDKARVASDPSFPFKGRASSSSMLDKLAQAYSLSSTRNYSAIGQLWLFESYETSTGFHPGFHPWPN